MPDLHGLQRPCPPCPICLWLTRGTLRPVQLEVRVSATYRQVRVALMLARSENYIASRASREWHCRLGHMEQHSIRRWKQAVRIKRKSQSHDDDHDHARRHKGPPNVALLQSSVAVSGKQGQMWKLAIRILRQLQTSARASNSIANRA